MAIKISEIDKNQVLNIIDHLRENSNSYKSISRIFQVHFETMTTGEDTFKYITRNLSESIKAVVVDCTKDIITSLTIYGNLNLIHADLIYLFGVERLIYNRIEDLTFHFFNEDHSSCVISYFSEGDVRGNFEEKRKISNLTFSPR